MPRCGRQPRGGMLERVVVTRVRLRGGGVRVKSCTSPKAWGMQEQMRVAARDNAEKPVRLGVIGVGIMGSNHARVLADLSGVQVVGIADPGASHRALLAQIVGCEVCDDAEELLD